MNSFATRVLSSVSGSFEPSQTAGAARVPWERSILIGILLLGTFLRFWGLGDIGLHREDEDTTGLAAIHILVDGVPRYPSGMAYGRAIVQSYLIGGSLYLFGNTEWALRLPSAVCGVLLIYLAYLLGRRFLSPSWNLVFALIVACLPGLILASQTARMYIFLLACLAGYAILVFQWERTDKLNRLLVAILLLILALQFQTIAIFATPLLFFPALRHGDVRKFWWACASSVVIYCAYVLIDYWIGLLYIEPEMLGAIGGGGATQADRVPPQSILYVAVAAVLALGVAFMIARRMGSGAWRFVAAALMVAAFACQVLLQYHLAVLAFAGGSVIAMREDRRLVWVIVVALLVAVGLTVAQGMMLHASGIESLRNKVGVMVGMPSVYAYAGIAEYSVGAVVTCGLGVVAALWALARKRAIPDVWLLFSLWAWIPLLAIGTFIWNPAQRYTAPALLPTLITAVFVLERLAAYVSQRYAVRPAASLAVAAVVGCLVILNPVELQRSVHSGYDIHPDHKGAAEYIKSLQLAPKDILVAEDAITQTYYLHDRIDYWLADGQQAAFFSRRVDGKLLDTYTDLPVVGGIDELAALVNDRARGDIYIVGTGEPAQNGMRNPVVHRLLTSGVLPVVYEGRDRSTKVWKIPPGMELRAADWTPGAQSDVGQPASTAGGEEQ